ncbi:MAG: hypothetical protein ACRDSK_20290 [Actinophytocola sp.]|uniref:hypothetical protein n=1 Tax=Actinophytocola sp. TaxID=1872138 RepID=UPI003D6A66B9
MGPLLRKLVELVLPWLVEERVSRWVVYSLYVTTTAVISYAFVLQNPGIGWFVVVPPVVLALWTRIRGLARVGTVLFVLALATTLVPAYFLGQFQSEAHIPVGPRLFAYLLFLLWVAAYPPVLDHLDRDKRRIGSEPAGPDPEAAVRVLGAKLWLATIVMLVVDETLAAVICLAALAVKAKWTAVLAGLACLVFPLLSFEAGSLGWDADVLDIAAALLAADQWRAAVQNPRWGVVSRVTSGLREG